MSIDISYNNSINCFNLLYYIITTTSFTVSFTLVNVFQYIYSVCLSILLSIDEGGRRVDSANIGVSIGIVLAS